MDVNKQDIKDLCARLEEAAVQSDMSAEHATVLFQHYNPQYDFARAMLNDPNTNDECKSVHQNNMLRIASWVFDNQRDADRWNKEASDFRLAAALLMKSITS